MYELLDKINSPTDLKQLSVDQLKTLSDDIRRFILDSVSKTGGHLASNLGVIEATVALHYVFNFSKDRLLWDVGHQCYAHKILTGRKADFHKLRQKDGPSGFPNPAESVYDNFMVGHAGTSVPTAIGMALGHAQLKQDEKVVALVGDASIVNGVSFEGLNNLGLVKRQLLIVLNDNSMAIDATQGSLAKYFSKIRLSQTYEDLRKTTKSILEHTPLIGKSLEGTLERIKKQLRMALPASQMFESLDIPYFGPVDGHDVASLVNLFKALGQHDHPAILHIYTKKGEGFTPAGEKPHKYHSTGPFKINGDSVEKKAAESKLTFTGAFGNSLAEIAEQNEKVVAITSAMGTGTGLDLFREKFPDRFYDVGIAESVAVDIAGGMAKCGLRPVVCIYSTFLQRAYDQIFQEVSLQNLPVVFCIDRAGLVGADGPTHHGMMDIGFLRMMPNMILLAPSDDTEMKLALEFALAQNKPVCIRYPKDNIPQDEFDRTPCRKTFDLGKSVTVRPGSEADINIVSYGPVLTEALKAAESLSEQQIEAKVINARFAAPIDESILNNTKGPIITIEDHGLDGGFGSALLETAAKMQVTRAIATLAAKREFIKHESRTSQLMHIGINADNIVRVAKEMRMQNTDSTVKRNLQ